MPRACNHSPPTPPALSAGEKSIEASLASHDNVIEVYYLVTMLIMSHPCRTTRVPRGLHTLHAGETRSQESECSARGTLYRHGRRKANKCLDSRHGKDICIHPTTDRVSHARQREKGSNSRSGLVWALYIHEHVEYIHNKSMCTYLSNEPMHHNSARRSRRESSEKRCGRATDKDSLGGGVRSLLAGVCV